MNNHIELVHDKKKPFKPYKCDICDYKCSKMSTWKNHVSDVHKGEKRFQCEVCEYKCFRINNMNNHIASVHAEMKPFKPYK